jgi:acyl-CoA thioesterase-1
MKYLIAFVVAVLALGMAWYFSTTKPVSAPVQSVPSNSATPSASPSQDEYLIVAFGDSLTAGYNVRLEESYPNQLALLLQKDRPNVRVTNMGVSGETTTGGLSRVDFVIAQNPKLVLLGLGANDMLRGTDPTLTRRNLEQILTTLQAAGISVVLLGMQSQSSNGADYVQQFNAIYPNLAEKYQVPLVPFFLLGVVLDPALNTGDGIHPNAQGYAKIIRENLLPVLEPLLPVLPK